MSTYNNNKISRNNKRQDKNKSLNNNNKMEAILITHYVNPHTFCYTKKRYVISGSAFVSNMESLLVLHCRADNQLQLYAPKLNVIVHFLPLKRNKLMRGRISAICQDNKYLVWAMDYGFNIICKAEDMWLLPLNLTEKYIPYEWGGLANVMPHTGNEWSEMSVNLLDQRLKEATELQFKSLYNNEQHIFGQLTIKSDKDSIDAATFLVDKMCARRQITVDGQMISNSLTEPYSMNMSILNEANFELSSQQQIIINLVENSAVPPVLPMHNTNSDSTTSKSNPTKDNNVVKPIPKEIDLMFNNRYHKLGKITRSLKSPLDQPERLDILLQTENNLTQPLSAQRLSKVKDGSAGIIVHTGLKYVLGNKSTSFGSSNSSSSFSLDSYDIADEQMESIAPENVVPTGQSLNGTNNGTKEPAIHSVKKKPVASMDKRNLQKQETITNQSKINNQKNLVQKPERYLNKADSADKDENKIEEILINTQVAAMAKLNLREAKSLQLASRKAGNSNKKVHKINKKPKMHAVNKNSVECIENRAIQNTEKKLENDNANSEVNKIKKKSDIYGAAPARSKNKVLAHSATPLTTESLFCIQLYAWPHLMRGNSLMLIERFKSERSLCYLPAICCQVMSDMRTGSATIGCGPLAILLTDTAIRSQILFNQCNDLMATYPSNTTLKLVNSHAHSMNAVVSMLLNCCGILVTTVTHLRVLLVHDLQLINAQRLKYFILDDYDCIKSKAPDLLCEVLHLIEMLRIPQTIFIAQQWHADVFLNILERFGKNPLLLFSDFLEAALYGGLKLNGIVLSKENKTEQLLKYLALQKPLTKRTLIYCQDQLELLNLKQSLKTAGYECIDSCNAAIQKSHQLLLILDETELSIQNYEQVVHYSLPSSWAKFSNSFHVLSNSIANYFVPSETKPDLVSYIMVDEKNHPQLWRLVQFFRAHNFVLDETTKELYANCQKLTERSRPICQNMLSSGECSLYFCDKRHFTVSDDFMLPTCALWQPGTVVRCNLLKIYDPVHFAFMPLRYKSEGITAVWKEATNLSAWRKLSTNLKTHMECKENRRVKQCLSVSDVCILRRSGYYRRVRIVNLDNKHSITVQLMDCSTELLNVRQNQLLECDARFTVHPPLAMDVRVCCLAPVIAEADWHTEATNLLTKLLNDRYNNHQVQFVVEFAMLNVVYVKEISLVQKSSNWKTYVEVAHLQTELILQNFGKLQSMQKLRKLHEHIVEEQKKILKDEEDKELAEMITNKLKNYYNAHQEDVNSNHLTVKTPEEVLAVYKETTSPTTVETPNTSSENSNEISSLFYGVIAGNAVRPKVRWHQTQLQIELIFEQQLVPQYELMHRDNVLIYQVTETIPQQRCILNLLGEVKILSQRQNGYQLHVKLAKQGLNVFWPTLLNSWHSQQHSRWLVYDTERAQPQPSDVGLNHWTRYQRHPFGRQGDGQDEGSLDSDEPSDDDV